MELSDLFYNFTNSISDVIVTEDEHQHIYFLVQIICITCYSITFILGVVGNGLVIWMAGFKMKKLVNTIWFLNLGIADFIFSCFLPFQIVEWAMNNKWIFGRLMCKLTHTILHLNMLVSISFLMIISVDHCTSVLFPVWSKNHRTPNLASIISKVTWLICLAFSLPFVAFYVMADFDLSEDESYCYVSFVLWGNITVFVDQPWKKRHQAMIIIRFVIMFLIPFSIILVCYFLITSKVRKNIHLYKSSRAVKIIIIVILCFFCCWFPYHIWRLFDLVAHTMGINWLVYEVVFDISYCLAIFNSCLSPILYVFIGQDFKKNLMKSIPLMLERTFSERCYHNKGNKAETELESIHS